MSSITKAERVERLRSVTLVQYSDEVTITRDDDGSAQLVVNSSDPRSSLLQELVIWVENRVCAPDDLDNDPVFIKRDSLVAELNRRLENLKESYGDRKGEFSRKSTWIGIPREDAAVLSSLFSDRPLQYDTKAAVEAALSKVDW